MADLRLAIEANALFDVGVCSSRWGVAAVSAEKVRARSSTCFAFVLASRPSRLETASGQRLGACLKL
jgi:hypothetical protein